MQSLKSKLKSGATSIYVVVIATLLFGVITVSFIRIIINEASRTTNDELAQSAYDSALAGVEDAKVALKKYYECVLTGADESDPVCTNVKTAIEKSMQQNIITEEADGKVTVNQVYCDGVAEALGRPNNGGVLIKESTSGDSQTVQAYTCVTLSDTLSDYRSTLSSGSTIRVIPLKTGDDRGIDSVAALKISWFSQIDGTPPYNYGDTRRSGSYTRYSSDNGTGIYYSPLETASTPPTISAQVIQTSSVFRLTDLDETNGDGQTDRATVFLTPTDSNDSAGVTTISRDILRNSNIHTTTKQPYKIRCNDSATSEFACSAILQLPEPVGGNRNSDTFFLVLSLPYGTPQTQFAVNLCHDDACNDIMNFSGVQVSIDSTGRANDMYSRVEARVEFSDASFPFPEFAIQATANDGDAIKKNFYVTSDCYVLTDKVDEAHPAGEWHIETCENTGEEEN